MSAPRYTVDDYPPGSLGYELNALETRVRTLPQPFRWLMLRRIRQTRTKLEWHRNRGIEHLMDWPPGSLDERT
jgi:hypothetical protein